MKLELKNDRWKSMDLNYWHDTVLSLYMLMFTITSVTAYFTNGNIRLLHIILSILISIPIILISIKNRSSSLKNTDNDGNG